MGAWRTNRISDYYKNDRLFNLIFFSENMSRDRILIILRCLHFLPKSHQGEGTEDSLYKIRPVLNFFPKKIQSIYLPSKNWSLDESVVLWLRSFKLYIKK